MSRILRLGTPLLFAAAACVAGATGCGSATNSSPTADATASPDPVTETAGSADTPSGTPGALDSPAQLPEARPVSPAGPEGGPVGPGTTFTSGSVSLRVVDAEGYREAIAQHRGKVVLVDFWATWCGPCKDEFPHSVELGRKWQDKGLAVVSVSFDDPESHQNALQFLTEQGATFVNLMSQHGASVESGVAFDIVGGALPFYKLYDRDGNLRYQFTANTDGLDGVLKTEELDKRVQELVAGG